MKILAVKTLVFGELGRRRQLVNSGCRQARILRGAGLLLAGLGLALGNLAAEPVKIRIGIEYNTPPLSFVNPHGAPDGFTAELLREVGREGEIEFQLVPNEWGYILQEFQAGRLDALANVVYTTERAATMEFSLGHATVHAITYTRPDRPAVRRTADMAGRKMGLITGSAAEKSIQEHQAWGAHVIGYPSKLAALRAVNDGACDFVFLVQPTQTTTAELGWGLHREFVEDFTVPFHVVVHRGDAARLAHINEGLARTMRSDAFDRIYAKWIGPIEPRPIEASQLRLYRWQIALGVLLVVAAFGWQHRVARVRRRLARQLLQKALDLLEAQRMGDSGSWSLDAATKKVTWTEPLYRMFGLDPSEPAPDLDQQEDLLTPASWQIMSLAVRNALELGQPAEMELEVAAPKGNLQFLAVRVEADRDASGRIVSAHGIAQNVTAQKLNEKKLHQMSQLYAALSYCNEAIVRSPDEKTLFEESCRGAVEIGGLALAWVGLIEAGSDRVKPTAVFGTGRSYLDKADISVSPNDPHGGGPTGRAIRENRPIFSQDFQQDPTTEPWHRAAAEYGLRSSACVPLTRGGKVVGSFTLYSSELGAFDDAVSTLIIRLAGNISYALDNLEREATRNRIQAAIHLQSAALNATTNTVVITDLKGNIEWVNPAFTKSTGYTAEEALGRNPRILKSGHQSEAYYAEMWKTIMAGRSWSGEFVNVRKDGALYTEEVTVTPVRDHAGAIAHFVAVKQDISEKLSLQKQLHETQRVESIGLLASGIAHDLNNILAPITLAMSLLKMKYPKESHLLEVTEQCAQRGAHIVRQVLTFARGADGRPAPVKVGRLVKEMVRLLSETLPRNIALSYDLTTDDDFICVDSTQLHQVLLNLAVNARDAMPQGGKLTFTLSQRAVNETEAKENLGVAPGNFVVIAVSDTGTGIAPENIKKIFDPFFTTKPRGQGTGLGLSTVQGIVRSSGGFIKVRSELGHGTEFQVYFPAVPEPTAEAASRSAHPFTKSQGELVLVVDDEATVLEVTRLILEQNGYTCMVASDGAAALELFKANLARVKVVVIDRMMPGMSGDAAAKLMHELAPAMPIFLATGLLGDKNATDDEAALLACGIRAILKKPFTEDNLLKVLRDALQPTSAGSDDPSTGG